MVHCLVPYFCDSTSGPLIVFVVTLCSDFFVGAVVTCLVITLLLCCGCCAFRKLRKVMDRNRAPEVELSNAMRGGNPNDHRNGHNGHRGAALDDDASIPNAAAAERVSRSSDEITWEMVWSEPMERMENSAKTSSVPWTQYDVDENMKNMHLLFTSSRLIHYSVAHQMRSLRGALQSIGVSLDDVAKTREGAPDIVRLLVSDEPAFRVRFADPTMVNSYMRALQKSVTDPMHFGSGWDVTPWINSAERMAAVQQSQKAGSTISSNISREAPILSAMSTESVPETGPQNTMDRDDVKKGNSATNVKVLNNGDMAGSVDV